MRSMSIAIRAPLSPMTPPKSHMASQNSRGRSRLRAYSASYGRPSPKRVNAARASRSGDGVHKGFAIRTYYGVRPDDCLRHGVFLELGEQAHEARRVSPDWHESRCAVNFNPF